MARVETVGLGMCLPDSLVPAAKPASAAPGSNRGPKKVGWNQDQIPADEGKLGTFLLA